MPVYEFQCKRCSFKVDRKLKVEDRNLSQYHTEERVDEGGAFSCNGELKRVITAVPFHFNTVGGTLGAMSHGDAQGIVEQADQVRKHEKDGEPTKGLH